MKSGDNAGEMWSGGREFIREILRRAEAKLTELQSRKDHLRRRMHALCSLANQSGLRVESRPGPGFRREVGVITPLEVAGPYEKRVVGLSGSKLRRACRIALMESDHPQSCEEIVQRIQRRGSLSFEARSNAQAVVEVELERMTRQGEAIHQQQDGGNRWSLRRG